MPPLEVEILSPTGQISERRVLNPGDPPATFSNNPVGKGREIIFMECEADDSSSTVARSTLGVDGLIAGSNVRSLRSVSGLAVIRVLRKGDAPLELDIQPDRSPIIRKVRFRHR